MKLTSAKSSRPMSHKQSPNGQPDRLHQSRQTRERLPTWILLAALAASSFAATYALVAWSRRAPSNGPPGMVWIPGGEFTMGTDSDLGWPDEKPAHRVRVDGFWMDPTEVTNAQFAAFVEATGYVTTAEKPPDVEEIIGSPLRARRGRRKKNWCPAPSFFSLPPRR